MALTRALHASSSSHASAKFTRSETKHASFRRASAIAVGVCDVKLLDTIAGFLLGAAGIERSTTVRVVRLADGASAWQSEELQCRSPEVLLSPFASRLPETRRNEQLLVGNSLEGGSVDAHRHKQYI